MIKAYYQLNEQPFSRSIKTSDLFVTANVQQAYNRLDYIIQNKKFAVLTGDSGVGKTTVIRKLAEKIDVNRHFVLYISDSSLTPRNFYTETLCKLGITPRFYRGDAKRQLQKAFLNMAAENKNPVVIVDESHLLDKSMLEEVRFLLNMQMDSYSPLSLIIVGQSELKEQLKLQVNSAIVQRIDLKCHITPFDNIETMNYINHQVKISGVEHEIFTKSAIKIIHDYTGGIARKINKLCLLSLQAGASQDQKLIDDHLIRDVINIEFEW